MKTVLIPRGSASQEDGITGGPGQLRADLERGELRMHDGVRQGGFRIPNIDRVKQLIAARGDDSATAGSLQVFATQNALADASPNAQTLALLAADGIEDFYIWRATAAGAGDIASTVDGSWVRVESQSAAAIRLWRLGVFDMQIGGVAPSSNQDTTAWLDAGVFKTWDGAEYLATTPTTFARLLAEIGGYSTSSFSLPDQLQSSLVESEDLNGIDDSGWWKSAAAADNAPIAGVHSVEHRKLSSTVAIQIVHVIDSATLARYIRYKSGGIWGAWALALDSIPARLDATASVVTDANSAVESGFYKAASSASNVPLSEDGTIRTVRYSSTSCSQMWQGLTSGHAYIRKQLASTWSSWKKLTVGDRVGAIEMVLTDAVLTGTLRLNGAAVSRTTYAELFAKWGTTFGAGNGSTTFNLKDVRGEFPRFWANDGSVDSGRVIASNQSEQVGPHNHTASAASAGNHSHTTTRVVRNWSTGGDTGPNSGWDGGNFVVEASRAHSTNTTGAHEHDITVNNNSGTENRPRNVALLALVRFE